ncbi:MAG: choice-of-anchor B family protein [Planctomycetota bacterium]|nr:choice-of-anchor B family protein [Planctomycetota bacterium]
MFTPLALLLLALPAAPQADGVTLLSKVQISGQCNDIWGYTAPDGREYAIVGTAGGTKFFNCTDPTAPYLTGTIPGPGSIWRDMKTYDQYAYIVTEGGGGMQIIDLNDPENPFLLKTWGTTRWDNAHNIACDEAEGKLWVCGTNNGTLVMDVATDPENPTWVATYNNNYVHDLHVQDGLAHLGEIYGGDYRIVRSDRLPQFPTKDKIQTPGDFTHNAWANESNTLCMTTDEVGGGRVALYDISNPSNIQFKDSWTIDNRTIPHNVFIKGDRAYISWYTEGFVCLDISDPSNIKKVGSYDTSPYGPGSGYHGAWGCYPFAPSGTIYISDMEEGFHCLRVDGPSIELDHTPLLDTQDEAGPYPVTVTATALRAGASVASVEAWYRIDSGSWQVEGLQQQGTSDTWSGSLPGQVAPTIVDYYIYAKDDSGRAQWSPGGSNAGDLVYSFLVGRERLVYFNDFEGQGDEGWTHGMSAGTDDWERDAPQGKGGEAFRHEGTVWQDPDVAYSGSKVWGNNLGLGNETGIYGRNSSTWLSSPSIDCSQSTRTILQFRRWASIEAAPYDRARIRVNGNVVWENPQGWIEVFHLVDNTWFPQSIDVSQYADGNASVVVTFELETDDAMELGGWAIDDFSLVSLESANTGNDILLTGPSSGSIGSTVAYHFSGAPAGGNWWAAGSLSNGGTSVGGHDFDLGRPYFVIDTGQVNSFGNGDFQAVLPPKASGLTIYLEIAASGLGELFDSNMLGLVVQ